MNNFFNHTPQPLSNVNQVENLASEVSEAFVKVEDKLFEDNSKSASIQSSVGDLDNSYIKEYVPNNGWVLNYTQNLYFPNNSQSSSLDLYPSTVTSDLNNVVVKNITNPSQIYNYKLSGILENDFDFTFVGRKIIFGKTPQGSDSLQITYKGFNTTIPQEDTDWSFELKYNVLQVKGLTGEIIKTFKATEVSSNTYRIEGFDFKSMCSEHIKNVINNEAVNLLKYVAIYSDDKRVEVTSMDITNSYVSFITEESFNKDSMKIYVANSSLSRLIECLYKLFYSHDHSINGGNLIDHSSLLGLYKNVESSNGLPSIQYQNTSKTNYDHPQYLNREGFIQDASVYNNSLLGDLLLASTSEDNRRNNLNSNSVKLIFGESNSGHRFYYNSSDDCLWLDSISRDGIRLAVPKDKKALSVNEHSFVDTSHKTGETDNALKLVVKSDNEEELGVFKITRKLVSVGNVATEDDKAVLLSYGSEHNVSLIKEKITIEDEAVLSFGSSETVKFKLLEDGLHITSDDLSNITNITRVVFDIPVVFKSVTLEHLDAKEIHLRDNQAIVFGGDSHEDTKGKLYYNNTNLSLASDKAFLIENNGKDTGISFANKNFIYTATLQGFPVDKSVDVTDLFVEARRDVYFIQSGYSYTPGLTSLAEVPRATLYGGEFVSNNFKVEYLGPEEQNGISLSNSSRIFSQKDEQGNDSIINNTSNVISSTGYTYRGGVVSISYGKFTGKIFTAMGDKTTDAGFYGNVIIPTNSTLVVTGEALFNNEITFTKPVNILSKLNAEEIISDDIKTRLLKVTEKAEYKDLEADTVEVLTELRFTNMIQTSHIANSSFEGTIQFNNNAYMPNSVNYFILGNKSIENDRNVSGLLLKNNEVRLGINGLVSAGKYLATKGTPIGNGDTNVGYTFATTSGRPDGDTGMFAEDNEEAQNGSDLVFRVDGEEALRLSKTPVDLGSLSLVGKEKNVVTVDLLLSYINDIETKTLERTYPIGTVYENSLDNRNPSVIFNWEKSVWKRCAPGRMLVGAVGSGVGEGADSSLNVPTSLNLSSIGSRSGDYQTNITRDNLPDIEIGKGIENGPDAWGDGSRDTQDVFPLTKNEKLGKGTPLPIIPPISVVSRWERVG